MSKRLLATCSLCQSSPALREPTGMRMCMMGAQGVSSGVRPPPLPSNGASLSCGVRTLSSFPLARCSPRPPVAYCSPAPAALLLGPSGRPHPASPSPLPRTDLWSLSLSARPPRQGLRLWCPGGWFASSVRLSLALLFSVQLQRFSPRL